MNSHPSQRVPIIPNRRPFVKAVAQSLTSDCGVREGDRVLIALSGGADSVAMTRALHAVADHKNLQLDLRLAHVHHHLRGADSDADADFARGLADQLGLPFRHADIRPADEPGNLEANARRLRYDVLTSIAQDIHADHVATAHHADDQLETILMKLIRGAGITGLAGIRTSRTLATGVRLIRPMLGVTHQQAIEFLNDLDQPWREDHTNNDTGMTRARIRADVLPVLRDIRADASLQAAKAAQHLADADRVTRRRLRRLEKKHMWLDENGTVGFKRSVLNQLPADTLGQLIRRVGRREGAPPDALTWSAVSPIVTAVRDGVGETRRFELRGPVHVMVTADEFRLRGPDA
ncbi:MAG: tRNA lysidine(34) synthetase TilS [Planctomycetota bacterium]|jgi:tRNA(Ile)-lysidine synthase